MNALPSELWLDLIGRPFVHRGRGPDAYDCYGLLLEINRRRGIILPDPAYEAHETACARALRANLAWWRPIPAITPGCGLLFRSGQAPQHVGVALDADRFLHASENHGSVLVSRLDAGLPRYRNLLLGAYEPCSTT